MSEKSTPARGDLWWVQFPGEDKQRPAVVVSPDVRNREGKNVIIAGCTTKRTDEVYDDEVLLDGLSLPELTKVQCDYLYTVKQSHLRSFEMTLLSNQIEKLNRALQIAVGIV